MSPRPKRITDTQLLRAAIRVVGERGADQTRLSDVAAVSGLAPATLVQRFGSLAGLLDAVSAALPGEVRELFDRPDTTFLAALAANLALLAGSRHLAFLAARPAGAAAYSLEVRKQIAFSLIRAVEAGELVHCDVALLARRIQIGYYGLATAALLEGRPLGTSDMAELLADVLGELT